MNENKVPYLAPGCFGSALSFRKTGMVCAACPFMSQCEPVHKESLATMRSHFGIAEPEGEKLSSVETLANINEPSERLTLPKKVRELLVKIDRASLDIAEKMKSGANPFSGVESFRYLQIACHLIMKFEAPVTQKLISAGLRRAMSWSEGTADAHARMAVQALEHVGAINNCDGILSVKK